MKKLFLILMCCVSFSASAENEDNASPYEINFTTPSKNIVCGGDLSVDDAASVWHGVSCFVANVAGNPPLKRPKNCEFDWGQEFHIAATGKPNMDCYSDYPYHPNPPVLAYGKTIRGKGWQCKSSKKGVRCVNQKQHGFEINRRKQVFF